VPLQRESAPGVQAMTEGFQAGFLVAVGFEVLGLLGAPLCCFRDRPPRKLQLTPTQPELASDRDESMRSAAELFDGFVRFPCVAT
jgi:hypothetical protein